MPPGRLHKKTAPPRRSRKRLGTIPSSEDQQNAASTAGKDLKVAAAAEVGVDHSGHDRRDVGHLVVGGALDRRGHGAAHLDLLVGPDTGEGDLDDLVLASVIVVVDLELVEQIGVERGVGCGGARRRACAGVW